MIEVKMNIPGVRETLRSATTQQVLLVRAKMVAQRTGEPEKYTVTVIPGKRRARASVFPKEPYRMKKAKHRNRLLGAVTGL